jgi:hypothetical protein
MGILRENREQLESLAESLLIKETLDRTQIESLMQGQSVVSDEERKAFEEAQKKAKDLRKNPSRASTLTALEGQELTDAPAFSALPQGT